MSHLKFTSYEGYGQFAKEKLHYSQAVRIGDIIECSGQGGWIRSSEGPKFSRDLSTQIEQAFENVDHNLKLAGARGWEDVDFIRSYHVPLNDEVAGIMVRCMKKWCPNHQPCWTELGVQRLGADDMRVEIDVKAHVGGGK